MRFAGLALGLLLLSACSSKPVSDTCPSPQTTGAAPHCVLSSQCIGSNVGVQLDCSGSTGCVCSMNGVTGATVDYQDSFCGTDEADALEAANSACGWKL